jgi:two-component system, LytTR family, response regulator
MPAPIRTLIVDDEPLCRERLRALLADDPDFTIVGECGDGAEAVATLRETPCDLVFLDVQMPVMDGLEVVEAIGPERMPTVIFVTAYDRYALRAFEVQALDYLLKPFDRERFEKALGRAKAHVQRDQSAEASRQLLALLGDTRPGRKHLERLVIKSGGRIFFLKMEEIDWIEAAGNYLRLHVGSETHLLRETMNALEGRIDPERFLRIHRSTIVNIERIREIQPLFHGDYVVLLRDGTELTLSRTYRQRLQEVLGATL